MEKAKCPHCSAKLPVLIFTGNRLRSRNGDEVIVSCHHCKKLIRAISGEEHKKNFTYILLSPLLGTPLIFSMQQFVPEKWKYIYFFLCYIILLAVPTIIGQHKMEFSKSK